MEKVGVVAFHAVVVMAALLAMWLALGKRQAGELTPFDIAVSITAGTVAGAGIVDLNIELGQILAALFMIGLTQVAFSWLAIKSRGFFRRMSYTPAVLVENGQIIKANLRAARMTAEMLFQLLREKEVFDVTEVELAVLEPTGRLSVLKKAEFLPLTAKRLGYKVPPNRVLVPVILEGELQEPTLARLGFSGGQIEAFRRQYGDRLGEVFVALMDKEGQVHSIADGVEENGSFLH